MRPNLKVLTMTAVVLPVLALAGCGRQADTHDEAPAVINSADTPGAPPKTGPQKGKDGLLKPGGI